MINKYSSIPLYSQLKDLIIEKIEKGEYQENSQIPSEQELCDLYSISRPTVRQAISELTNSGYLYKQKGKGTFVSKSKHRIDIRNYSGFTDSILDSQIPDERTIVFSGVITCDTFKKLEDIFAVHQNHTYEFAKISYLTLKDNEILSLNTSYIPLNLFPSILEDVAGKKTSYDILRGKYPLIPAKSKSSLEIVYTEQSDAQYLQVQIGQPLMKIENVLYSKSGQAVEYVTCKYCADKCTLGFENSK